ncbi:Two-component response regulator, AmiR/NasT family, consists of REC and RNA-binding antiterminator (ANTAR) domains [Faunimonas pinastri]|uniref:Two-component response regulator, AmiR/NasT family, consists of REC and RNA-binding antiterminator (ANTAR) domains n=1 Tax=Faunimonas pinastri TaxID=1855383 RepID=A0A1H9NDA2_9HYPH|nr:ANTAR domain-containing protein [Faunimonas pinastri]SER33737.1 Two-component response regulator, AmiR/NasT family, consists of REC and RNA-binding antiterminator (ANTAR) domains [Faunimonas pinastri]
MTRSLPAPHFRSWKALVLHRAHPAADALLKQLEKIGVAAEQCWPDLPFKDRGSSERPDVIFFDADMGYDEQFPWAPGQAPMPQIAMIGSEAPGRIEWALRQGADTHVLKPIGSSGVFGALLIAHRAFARRQALEAELAALQDKQGRRTAVARATALLMVRDGLSDKDAFRRLQTLAMASRLSLEDAADATLAHFGDADVGRNRA